MTNGLVSLANELVVLLDPVRRVVADRAPPRELTLLLRRAGWRFPGLDDVSLQDFTGSWSRVLDAVDALPELVEADSLGEALEALGTIGEAVAALSELHTALAELLEAVGDGLPPEALEELGTDVLQLLVIEWLARRRPVLLQVLRALLIVPYVDVERIASGGGAVVRQAGRQPRVEPAAIGTLLGDPVGTLRTAYLEHALDTSEDAQAFNALLSSRLRPLAGRLGGDLHAFLPWEDLADLPADERDAAVRTSTLRVPLPSPIDAPIRPALTLAAEVLSAEDEGTLGHRGPGMELRPGALASLSAPAGTWTFDLAVSSTVAALFVGPDDVEGEAGGSFAAAAGLTRAAGDPVFLGAGSGTRIEFGTPSLALAVDLSEQADLTVEVLLEDAALVASPGDGDSFLQGVLPDVELRAEFDLGLAWSRLGGLRLSGGTELTFTIPLTVDIAGVVMLDEVVATLEIGEELALSLAVSGGFELGPLTARVQRVGLRAALAFPDGGGNLPLADMRLSFLPPDGVGFGADIPGVLSGGGFLDLDPEIGRYAGIGELEVVGVGIVAIGILDTQIPGAPDAWSLFFSLSATFTSIPLGFGFTLNGVGGLVGIDRGLDEDALGEAVRSGSLDAILFPENAIADAALILSEIDAVFPGARGQYVFGPIVKIGWGAPTLIEIDAGVVIQLPDPLTISLLGALHAVLPREEVPILELHVNFAGTVNLTEGTLKIDASLSGSQVAGLLITGDMAVRVALLDDPTFLVAFGGFHPKFVAPADFPELDPVGVALDTGEALRVSLGGYFALTSNSVQFGARADLWAGAEGFSIEGGTSFDALFMFDPFSLSIRLRLWVSVMAGDTELLGVLLKGTLSGPNPWKVAGVAEFRLLGLEKRFEVDESFGELANEGPPDRADPSQLVREALRLEDAWSALGPPGPDPVLVSDPGTGPALHPSGRVQVTQRLVPLDTTIECYGNSELVGDDLVALEAVGFGEDDVEDVRDWFASAQYFLLDEDEKLVAPSFTQMKAGLVMGGSGGDAPEPAEVTFDHEIAYRDPHGRPAEPPAGAGPVSARDEAMTRALGTDGLVQKVRYDVEEPLWIVANADIGRSTGATPTAGIEFFAARNAMARHDPLGSLLMPSYEAELLA